MNSDFFLILSGWRGCKGILKKISVPMTLNRYLEENRRFKLIVISGLKIGVCAEIFRKLGRKYENVRNQS